MSGPGHEREISLSFKYAYRPSLVKRQDALVSPRESDANLGATYPRPSVCSPPSLPLRQDAIFQSFPAPTSRASPRRDSPRKFLTNSQARSTPPSQALEVGSPRNSPRPSPRRTPQRTPRETIEEFNWGSSDTETTALSLRLVEDGSGTSKSVRSLPELPMRSLDGGETLEKSEHKTTQSQHSKGQSKKKEKQNKRVRNIVGPPKTDIIGSATKSSPEAQKDIQQVSLPVSNQETRKDIVPKSPGKPKNSTILKFLRSTKSFPLRTTVAKDFINACMPRNSKKQLATPQVNEMDEISDSGKISDPSSQKHTPTELSTISTSSSANRHNILEKTKSATSRKDKKYKSKETTPVSPEASIFSSIKEQDSQNSCFVAGEAQRFRTPLESPRIPGTPPTPIAISPKTTEPISKEKQMLPSYFDLRRKDTNVSPFSAGGIDITERGYTLMPLSDSSKEQYDRYRMHAHMLPHFVRVPFVSHAAPFAQKEDYGPPSGDQSPKGSSRRSSFPSGRRISGRSSTSATMETGRRASFGYREHMSFLTRPDGYSTSTESPDKRNSGSSASVLQGKIKRSPSREENPESSSRKASLGERRASRAVAAMEMARRKSNEKSFDDGDGGSSLSSQGSKMVHWRGAEVTEDEARMLDMLVGKHRLFSEMFMTPLDKTKIAESSVAEDAKAKPETILRRPSWKRFASTMGPLTGLSEEMASPDAKTDDIESPVANVSELYAEALQQTMGLPVNASKRRSKPFDFMENAPKLSPVLTEKHRRKDFITAPADIKRNDASSSEVTNSRRSTRTEFEAEILSIAMLYGRIVQESTRPASEPDRSPSIENRPHELSRAPSLTVAERPSISFLTSALDDRSNSDSIVSDVRRVSLNPQSTSRRSSSAIARLAKIARSKRNSAVSALDSPYENGERSRHASLNVPSLISALKTARANNKSRDGRHDSVGSGLY